MIENIEHINQFDSQGKRIGIFVIAYDAESNINQTLDRISEAIWEAIEVLYVVDDCSRDETVQRAMSFTRWKEKIVVLRNRVNQRYGGNQKIGYQFAVDHNLDAVVMLHADGQYAPECLAELLIPIVSGDAKVVLGSRMINRRDALKGGMPYYKYVGNIILTKLQNVMSGLKLSEFHSGYRAYSVAFLKQIPFWENSNEWHFDTQILLQAKQLGVRIVEVSIPTYYGDEICHVNGITYGLHCIITTLGYSLHRGGIVYGRNYDLSVSNQIYTEKFKDPASSHSLIYDWLSVYGVKGKKVLELGVGDASLTKRLHESGAHIDAVELNKDAADNAQPFAVSVTVSDLNNVAELALDEDYDLIIAADILEHLYNAEYVVSSLKKHLKKGGFLIVSLPNVANIYVRLNLLFGRFPYHSKGILDRTHVHFYTLKTAEQLLKKTGWIVEGRTYTIIPLSIVFPFLTSKFFRPCLYLFWYLTRVFRGLLSYQGVFFCRNPNDSCLL